MFIDAYCCLRDKYDLNQDSPSSRIPSIRSLVKKKYHDLQVQMPS